METLSWCESWSGVLILSLLLLGPPKTELLSEPSDRAKLGRDEVLDLHEAAGSFGGGMDPRCEYLLGASMPGDGIPLWLGEDDGSGRGGGGMAVCLDMMGL